MPVCADSGTDECPPDVRTSIWTLTAPFSAMPKRANGTPYAVSTPVKPSSSTSAMPSLP